MKTLIIILAAAHLVAQPVVRLAPLCNDLGRVNTRALIPFSFLMHNDGNKPLYILGIEPDCGCTTHGNDSRTYAIRPNESTEIPFFFSTKGIYGNFEKSIKFNTNDPESPIIIGKIKGVGIEPVQLDTAMLTVKGTRDEVLRKTIEVKYNDPVRIPDGVRITVDKPWLKVVWDPIDVPGGRGRLYCEIDMGAVEKDASEGRGIITLDTHSDAYPEAKIPVFWLIDNPFEMSPRPIVGRGNNKSKGKVKFCIQSKVQFSILKAEVSSGDFMVQPLPFGANAKRWDIEIEPKNLLPHGKRIETFHIWTDSKDLPEIKGEFFFVVD